MTDLTSEITRLQGEVEKLTTYLTGAMTSSDNWLNACEKAEAQLAKADEEVEKRIDDAENAIWDDVLRVVWQAWPEKRSYCDSPVELITAVIDERDEARAQLAKAEATLAAPRAATLRTDLFDAQQQLVYWWETTGSCPCGARRESPRSHPHVIGCPTADALLPSAAVAPEKDTQ